MKRSDASFVDKTAALRGALRAAVKQVLTLLFYSLLLWILELSDTHVYVPEIRALVETASQFCEVVVFKLSTVPIGTALSVDS